MKTTLNDFINRFKVSTGIKEFVSKICDVQGNVFLQDVLCGSNHYQSSRSLSQIFLRRIDTADLKHIHGLYETFKSLSEIQDSMVKLILLKSEQFKISIWIDPNNIIVGCIYHGELSF